LRGLLLPGERKSIEPVAARVAPGHEQELRHFVSESPWEAEPVEQVLWSKADAMLGGQDAFLIIDDTALPKKGDESVGVAHQYCGALGKQANCQSLVSLTLARGDVPVPVALRLYLPEPWAKDKKGARKSACPRRLPFNPGGGLRSTN
jgi:SRSO17 transposase